LLPSWTERNYVRHASDLSSLALTTLPLLAVALIASGCSPLAVCAPPQARGAPTYSDGPVAIGLDHSRYGPDDPIQITITNHLDVPVALFWQVPDTCLPFFLFRQDSATPALKGAAPLGGGQACHSSERYPANRDFSLQPNRSYGMTFDHK